MTTLRVELGKRSYDICIEAGVLNRVEAELSSRGLQGPVFIVTSPRIQRLHGAAILNSLQNTTAGVRTLLVPEGEASKSLEMTRQLYTQLIRAGADRSALMLALGGGVIGDLAGFAAATFLRGIRLVQIPTTLLAQIDSAIGGKVGVNHPLGKNLIGAFHQPAVVLADPEVLRTLPASEWRSGLFEAIKYGIIADAELFLRIESHIESLRNRDLSSLDWLVESCAGIKARIVSRDERESRLRMVLNLGHTAGHALEAVTHYSLLKHGEAVGWGMLFAVEFAWRSGLLKEVLAERIRSVVVGLGLPSLPKLRSSQILTAMQQDKKRSGDALRLILPVRLGRVVIHETRDRGLIIESLRACGIAQV